MRDAENVQAIIQGRCSVCEEIDDNFDVTGFDSSSGLEYSLVCQCGEESTIRITEEGVDSTNNVSYADASWNRDDNQSEELTEFSSA